MNFGGYSVVHTHGASTTEEYAISWIQLAAVIICQFIYNKKNNTLLSKAII